MSTSAPKQNREWLVLLPDNPNILSHRMSVRPQHLRAIEPLVASGRVVMGGATLDEPLQNQEEGEAPKINGSAMIYEAETEGEVRKMIEGDVYYTSGVWDVAKIQIIPFKSAVRVAL